MLPSVAGPGTVPPPPPPGLSARADQGAQPTTGETSASATRPLVANRVDPPRVLPSIMAFSQEAKRRLPPDPDGPAGPPPAFDATPLERERQRLLARVDLMQPPPEAKVPERPAAARPPDTAAEAPAPDPVAALPDRPVPEADVPAPDSTALEPATAARDPEAAGLDAAAAPETAAESAPVAPPKAPAAPRVPEDSFAPVEARETAPAIEADTRAIERLETDVAEVRRMTEPEPERSLDLVR